MTTDGVTGVNQLLDEIRRHELQIWSLIDAQHKLKSRVENLSDELHGNKNETTHLLESLDSIMNQIEAHTWQIVPNQLRFRMKLVELSEIESKATVNPNNTDVEANDEMSQSTGTVKCPSKNMDDDINAIIDLEDGRGSEILKAVSACNVEMKQTKAVVNALEGKIGKLMDEKFAFFGKKMDEKLKECMEALTTCIGLSSASLLDSIKEQFVRQSSLKLHQQRQPISFMPRKINSDTNKRSQEANTDSAGDAEGQKRTSVEGILGDLHPTTKLNSVDDLVSFEEKIINEDVANVYSEFYHSILEAPSLREDADDNEDKGKNNRTLMYTIANQLFGCNLFGDKITWTGNSPSGKRVRFANFDNLFSWTHSIMLRYDNTITLGAVKEFYQLRICKPAKNRTGQVRRSTGRKYSTRTRKSKGQIKRPSNGNALNDDGLGINNSLIGLAMNNKDVDILDNNNDDVIDCDADDHNQVVHERNNFEIGCWKRKWQSQAQRTDNDSPQLFIKRIKPERNSIMD